MSRLENLDRFLPPGRFLFAFDFVCVGCLVVGCFVLLMRVLQSLVGFRGRNWTWGFGMHLGLRGIPISFINFRVFSLAIALVEYCRVDRPLFPFYCLIAEWLEVKRRLPPVRLGAREGSTGSCLLQVALSLPCPWRS